MKKTFRTTLLRARPAIPVPFDPKAAFGKARAPVVVTLNGYSYRSTIFTMGGVSFVPLRRSHRQAAVLEASHQREYAEAVVGAKKEETRLRRIEAAVKAIASRSPR